MNYLNIHEILRTATRVCILRDNADKYGPFTEVEETFDGGVLWAVREVLAEILDCYPEDISFEFDKDFMYLKIKGEVYESFSTKRR